MKPLRVPSLWSAKRAIRVIFAVAMAGESDAMLGPARLEILLGPLRREEGREDRDADDCEGDQTHFFALQKAVNLPPII